MTGKREIAGWITAFGNHIPIYTDDPNLDSYKEMWERDNELEREKEERNKLKQRGSGAGDYKVYRAGDLSGASTGLIYFALDKETADKYAKPNSFTMQGTRYKRPRRTVKQYDISVKSPLVVSAVSDVDCAKLVYAKLYSGKDFMKEAKKQGVKITGYNSLMLYLDRANGKALPKSKYDSIQYKTYNTKTQSHILSQIIVPAGSKLLKDKTRTNNLRIG